MKKIFYLIITLCIFFALTSCGSPSNSKNENPTEFPYSFSSKFKIIEEPTGTNYDNLAFVLQLPPQEGQITNLKVQTFKAYQNNKLLVEKYNFDSKIDYNSWINDKGQPESNYQTLYYCLPEHSAPKINLDDEITIIFECIADRCIINPLKKYLIDNSKAVGLWKQVGNLLETANYLPEPIPEERITYQNQTYKLVFLDNFDKDYSSLNPLKNGIYKQPQNMNNWWTEDWGTYSNVNNGYENRTIKNFKIKNGVAEFPLIREGDPSKGENYRNTGPSLVTSVWDPKGINSIPLYEFNKGIFEIRFKGPTGNNHPGQFTFWVLNYNTNFEAGRYPTNPKKAQDGYALDEIDFFEYSPSRNIIRTGARSCNSVNHRPSAGYSPISLPANFGGNWHVFRCAWTDSGLESFLDGKSIYTVSASQIKGFVNPNDKFMMLISAQSIAESGIDGDVYSSFQPYSYFVDYIKVYQKE